MTISSHQPCAHPNARVGAGGSKISSLLVTRVDFGSVKHHTAVNDYTDGRAMPYRSKIGHDGAQISLSYHFSVGGGGRTHAHLVR